VPTSRPLIARPTTFAPQPSSKCRPVERRSQIVEAPQSRARDGDVALRVRRGIQPFRAVGAEIDRSQQESSRLARGPRRPTVRLEYGGNRHERDGRFLIAHDSLVWRTATGLPGRPGEAGTDRRRTPRAPSPPEPTLIRICSGIRNPPRPTAKHLKILERVKGIEPSYSAWKAAALPLSYTRDFNILGRLATHFWHVFGTEIGCSF
jgi:hypothetical protein